MKNYKPNPKHMFSGDLAFLSNMYPCFVTVDIDGESYTFKSSEAAFQAGKCIDVLDIQYLTQFTKGNDAKRYGRKVKMASDWNERRVDWMQYVCKCKFEQNQDLLKKLLETYPLALVETNTWKDTFWGVCDGKGENHLGKILMKLREQQLQDIIENHFQTEPSIPNMIYGMPTDVFLSVLTQQKSIWIYDHTTDNAYEYTADGFNGTVFYEEDYCHGCRMDNIEFHPKDYNKRWFTSYQEACDYHTNRKG